MFASRKIFWFCVNGKTSVSDVPKREREDNQHQTNKVPIGPPHCWPSPNKKIHLKKQQATKRQWNLWRIRVRDLFGKLIGSWLACACLGFWWWGLGCLLRGGFRLSLCCGLSLRFRGWSSVLSFWNGSGGFWSLSGSFCWGGSFCLCAGLGRLFLGHFLSVISGLKLTP